MPRTIDRWLSIAFFFTTTATWTARPHFPLTLACCTTTQLVIGRQEGSTNSNGSDDGGDGGYPHAISITSGQLSFHLVKKCCSIIDSELALVTAL